MSKNRHTLVIGGQSRLPKDLSQGESLQVVVELDTESDNGLLAAVMETFADDLQKVLRIYLKLDSDHELF